MSVAVRGSAAASEIGDRLARHRDVAGDPVADRDAKLLHLLGLTADGDLEHELLGVLVDQQQRARAGAEHLRGGLDDHLQEVGVRDPGADRSRSLREAERLSEARGEAYVVVVASGALHGRDELTASARCGT